jgi:oxygen-dependent protoporphyrinogen oxidase
VKFAVVGGGIAGLSAAWELAGAGGTEVTVYEPGHLGGKLLTTMFLGRPVDEGPDSLITRVPEGLGLFHELGLGEDLGAPEAKRAMLFARGNYGRSLTASSLGHRHACSRLRAPGSSR